MRLCQHRKALHCLHWNSNYKSLIPLHGTFKSKPSAMTFSQHIFRCKCSEQRRTRTVIDFTFSLTSMMELFSKKKKTLSQSTGLWLKVCGCTDSTFVPWQAESGRPHKIYTTVEPTLHLYNHQTQLHWDLFKWFYWNSIFDTSPTCHRMWDTSEKNQSEQRHRQWLLSLCLHLIKQHLGHSLNVHESQLTFRLNDCVESGGAKCK